MVKLFSFLMVMVIVPVNLVKVERQIEYVDSLKKFNEIPALQINPFSYLKSSEKKSTKPKVRFVFIRHAETPTNVEGGLPGSRTSLDQLTEMGKLQAESLGKELLETGISFDEYFRSPTPRTKETLEIIQRILKTTAITPQIDERLHEKYHGRYERYQGLSQEARIQLKQDYLETKLDEEKNNRGPLKSFQEKFAYSPDSAHVESLSQIFYRISDFLNEMFQKEAVADSHEIKNYLVVSHYAILKALFMYGAFLRGYDLDYRAHDIKNGGIVIVEVDSEGMQVVAADGLTFRSPKQ